MTRHAVNANANASLYAGAPAVAFVLRTADHAAYAAAVKALDTRIDIPTRQRLDRAQDRIASGQVPALREFDLISGLTGIGAYLLHRSAVDDELLREVLSYLVRLSAASR
jgi:lantibiotic biosynthesis protein